MVYSRNIFSSDPSEYLAIGIYDSVFGYMKDGVGEMRGDLAVLFAGEAIPSDIHEYAATSMELKTKDEIYSAMVVYGLLTCKA